MKTLKIVVSLIVISSVFFLNSCTDTKKKDKVEQKTEQPIKKTEKQSAKLEKALLVGSWVEKPKGEFGPQGFTLYGNNKASSIKTATLVYQKWRTEGNNLILTSKSIGNGSTSVGDETYEVLVLDNTTLKIKINKSIIEYQRIPTITNNIYFDKKDKKWKDENGICHTCTPENGYNVNGTMDE